MEVRKSRVTDFVSHVTKELMEKKRSLLLLKLVLLFAAVLAATGCQTRLQQLQHAKPSGNDYTIALAQEYLAFAESEADQYDWIDSHHFALKGLRAAAGEAVMPDAVSEWDIKPEIQLAVLQARGYLIDVVESRLVKSKGAEVARAQVLFDCWLEQQEEGWQDEDIRGCREGFYDELDVLYAELYPKAVIEERVISKVKTKPGEAPGPYRIFFGFNQAKLDANANEVVNKAVADLRQLPSFTIMLNGYADKTGNAEYNMQLSKKRAMAVKKALVSAGVDEGTVQIFAFGEAAPANHKKNSKRDHRVVEIIVQFNE